MSLDDRRERWRLVLGESADPDKTIDLGEAEASIDRALGALYDPDRDGGLAAARPRVARWLGDIRRYFPASVVQILQRDALDRLGLKKMLFEPELLASIEPDLHLAATLLELKGQIPPQTRETARNVVRRVVDEILARLQAPLLGAVRGALRRTRKTPRPRWNEIDWPATIRRNLIHYRPERRAIVPRSAVGFRREQSLAHRLILAVDQSASMASSVVYAGVLASALALLPNLSTHLVLFDTRVVDLSDRLYDPVDLLFGVHLGGGTDIERALAYCQTLVEEPLRSTIILISDLDEGGSASRLLERVQRIVASGTRMVVLLALSDEGRPVFDHDVAAMFAELGIAAFGCSPDRFPELLASVLGGADPSSWAVEAAPR
ncbi:MAG: VWA domain-containing protein [Myxococcales bacterium]|nr:VWA domain-containing protein [Myxococcales bacterium]